MWTPQTINTLICTEVTKTGDLICRFSCEQLHHMDGGEEYCGLGFYDYAKFGPSDRCPGYHAPGDYVPCTLTLTIDKESETK